MSRNPTQSFQRKVSSGWILGEYKIMARAGKRGSLRCKKNGACPLSLSSSRQASTSEPRRKYPDHVRAFKPRTYNIGSDYFAVNLPHTLVNSHGDTSCARMPLTTLISFLGESSEWAPGANEEGRWWFFFFLPRIVHPRLRLVTHVV